MKIDYYSYINDRAESDPGLKDYVLGAYKKANKRQVIMMMINLLFIPRFKSSIKYVFLGDKYSDLIECLPRNEVAIIGGVRDLIYCYRRGFSYIPLPSGLFSHLINDLSYGNNTVFYGGKFKLFFEKNLNLNLFLSTDTLPRERWILSSVSELLKNIIVVQHGIVQSKQAVPLVDGKYSDFVLCYNEQQKKIYEKYLRDVSKVKVIDFGFYKELEVKNDGKRSFDICLVDQPFDKIKMDFKDEYFLLMSEFIRLAKAESYSICIKRHPGSDSLLSCFSGLPELTCDYEQSFLEAEYYVSLTSTYLYEAELRGCRVYQIRTDIIPQDIYHETINLATHDNIKKKFEMYNGNVEKQRALDTRFFEFLRNISS